MDPWKKNVFLNVLFKGWATCPGTAGINFSDPPDPNYGNAAKSNGWLLANMENAFQTDYVGI